MKLFYKAIIYFSFLFAAGFTVSAQNRFFTYSSESNIKLAANEKRTIIPQKYQTVSVNATGLKNFLWSLPSGKNLSNRKLAPIIELPMPGGNFARFRVWESSIQEPALEATFPGIRTFLGQGIDDPYATIRFDYTYFGFHAQVLSVNGNIYIDPYARGNTENYISYYSKDNIRNEAWRCEMPENAGANKAANAANVLAGPCRGTQLSTYRLAVACTGEYAVAVGGTTPALLHSAIVTTVNRVVGVYEDELSVSMVLIANNNTIEFLNANTDPFNGNDDAGTLINESQTVITSMIGNGNFDIGHTFSTGGGGLAGLGVVCINGQKASGITGSPNPVGDAYDIDYVAHEMGHQFGGDHTFNSNAGACNGNRNASTAYEVGSATTIMGYAGICSNDDIQPHSDPTFHTVSFDEISNYLQGGGGTCGVITPTGNTLPQITSMTNNNVSIPPSTPFTLTATATDADGDAITYCWEEWDLGPSTTWNGGTANATSPLFKSLLPKTDGSRTFPDPARIAANYLPATPPAVMNGLKGETLPTTARTMKFRLTVRDNRAGGGGIVTGGNGCQTGYTATYSVAVSGTNPFAVTVPNGGESYVGGSTQTVTWNVVNTTAAPFNVANVKISLSTDGGLTFPTVISASTANDGSESLTIPATPSTTARIKVEALGNVFFDISNANFTITQPAAGYTFNSVAPTLVACGSVTSANATLGTTSTGGFVTPINLSTTGTLPAGTSVAFSPNPVTPGSSTTVTLTGTNTLAAGTYDITVQGVAGAITQTSTVSFTIQPGTPPSITSQPANASVCAGDVVNLSVISPTAGVSYQWQVDDSGPGGFVNIPGATSSTYSFTSAQSDNGSQYQVIVSTLCGTATSSIAALTVNTAANITTQPSNQTVCANANASFTVAATGTGITYQWQVDDNGPGGFVDIPGATSATLNLPSVTPSMSGNQYHVVISASGSACAAPGNSNDVTLTVNPLPVLTGNSDDANVCSGTSTSVHAQETSGLAGVSYSWTASSGTITSGANTADATVTPVVDPGAPTIPLTITYTVTGTASGCSSTQTVEVTANPLPTVTLTADPSNTNITLPSQVITLTANVTPAGPNYTYDWTQNGQPISNNTNTLQVDVSQVGEYDVTVSVGGQCANTSNKISVADSILDKFYIYPNPNTGQFKIQLRNPNLVGNVTCFDSKGARVYASFNTITRLPYQVIDVDLGNVSSGVYVLTIYDKGGERMATERVVVRR